MKKGVKHSLGSRRVAKRGTSDFLHSRSVSKGELHAHGHWPRSHPLPLRETLLRSESSSRGSDSLNKIRRSEKGAR